MGKHSTKSFILGLGSALILAVSSTFALDISSTINSSIQTIGSIFITDGGAEPSTATTNVQLDNNGIAIKQGALLVNDNTVLYGPVSINAVMDLGGNKIINLSLPNDSKDIVNKEYVDDLYQTQDLATVLGNGKSASGNRIINLPLPTATGDLANKKYVDDLHATTNLVVRNLGQVLVGSNDAEGDIITDLPVPSDAGDATNKNYVDSIANVQDLENVLSEGNDAQGQSIDGVNEFTTNNLFTDLLSLSDSSLGVCDATNDGKVRFDGMCFKGCNGVERLSLGLCDDSMRPMNCPDKPANSIWNVSSSFTQTWDRATSTRLPVNKIATHNTAPSDDDCHFVCDSSVGAAWNGNACVIAANCFARTQDGYTIPDTNDGNTTPLLNGTIAITNGTKDCTRTYTCNDGTFTGNTENCTIGGCGIDFYEQGGACVAVADGEYSADGSTTKGTCTGKPANAHYTSAGNGTPTGATRTCDTGYVQNGSVCDVDSGGGGSCSFDTNKTVGTTCGNGYLDAGEQCDRGLGWATFLNSGGNESRYDGGCSSTCQIISGGPSVGDPMNPPRLHCINPTILGCTNIDWSYKGIEPTRSFGDYTRGLTYETDSSSPITNLTGSCGAAPFNTSAYGNASFDIRNANVQDGYSLKRMADGATETFVKRVDISNGTKECQRTYTCNNTVYDFSCSADVCGNVVCDTGYVEDNGACVLAGGGGGGSASCGDGIRNGVPLEICDRGAQNGQVAFGCNASCRGFDNNQPIAGTPCYPFTNGDFGCRSTLNSADQMICGAGRWVSVPLGSRDATIPCQDRDLHGN